MKQAKRIAALLLTAVLGLTLAACGKAAKYEDLIDMLENGQYSDAIAYIAAMQTSQGSGLSIEGSDSNDASNSPLLPLLEGTWVSGVSPIIYGDSDTQIQSCVFRADGTCALDGVEMTWQATGATELNLTVQISQGETPCYTVNMYSNSNLTGEYSLSLAKYSDQSSGITIGVGSYINTSHYDVVEVTTENWQEYFELTQKDKYRTNSFGETEGLDIQFYLSLKPEYLPKLSSLAQSKGAVEMTYTACTYQGTLDLANNTYQIGSFVNSTSESHDYTFSHHNYAFSAGSGNTDDFSVNYESAYYGPIYNINSVGFHRYPKDVKIERLQATLYFCKNS